MTRGPASALAWAKSKTSGYGGMCLKFVRLAFDVPAKYGTARDARKNSKYFHATSDPNSIPAGVPVYLGDNHIAISAGGGLMVTTNVVTNKIKTVTIASWVRGGFALKGWAEDLNGVRVWTAPAAPKPTPASPKPGASNGGVSVSAVQSFLRRSFPAYKDSVSVKRGQLITVDGIAGPQYKAWVKEFQRRTGLVADGIVGPKTIAKMRQHGL